MSSTTEEVTQASLVPVDSGLLLTVDPCHLPVEVLRALVTPDKDGVARGVITNAPGGDGWHEPAGMDWAEDAPNDGQPTEITPEWREWLLTEWSAR